MSQNPLELESKVFDLAQEHRVPLPDVRRGVRTGAYSGAIPLDVLEFFLHEASHLLVAGSTRLLDAPDWGALVADQLENFSSKVQDALEVDTCVLTCKIGRALGLDFEAGIIYESMCHNLQHPPVDTLKDFEERVGQKWDPLDRKCADFLEWFEGQEFHLSPDYG